MSHPAVYVRSEVDPPAPLTVFKEPHVKFWRIDLSLLIYEWGQKDFPWRLWGWKTFFKCFMIALLMLSLRYHSYVT